MTCNASLLKIKGVLIFHATHEAESPGGALLTGKVPYGALAYTTASCHPVEPD
jgi:hypothetical protein